MVVGPNGSGKTSLLESIYLLGSGRSFRTSRLQKIIRSGEREGTVFARIQSRNRVRQIGIQRSHEKLRIQVDQEEKKGRKALAEAFAVGVVAPGSHQIIEGGPQVRRQFFDWGVFHVEHSFKDSWAHYQRALKQRNELLAGEHVEREQVKLWNKSLVSSANQVISSRESYIEKLNQVLSEVSRELFDSLETQLEHYPGFSRKFSYEELLDRNFERDSKLGFTEQGPHRGDVRIRIGDHEARDWSSRGQQKLLVYTLVLSQLELIKQTTGVDAVLLLDDLPAELDGYHIERVLGWLGRRKNQVFITTTHRRLLPELPLNEAAMFHVKHGEVTSSSFYL